MVWRSPVGGAGSAPSKWCWAALTRGIPPRPPQGERSPPGSWGGYTPVHILFSRWSTFGEQKWVSFDERPRWKPYEQFKKALHQLNAAQLSLIGPPRGPDRYLVALAFVVKRDHWPGSVVFISSFFISFYTNTVRTRLLLFSAPPYLRVLQRLFFQR